MAAVPNLYISMLSLSKQSLKLTLQMHPLFNALERMQIDLKFEGHSMLFYYW
jgi:hypothetical protein